MGVCAPAPLLNSLCTGQPLGSTAPARVPFEASLFPLAQAPPVQSSRAPFFSVHGSIPFFLGSAVAPARCEQTSHLLCERSGAVPGCCLAVWYPAVHWTLSLYRKTRAIRCSAILLRVFRFRPAFEPPRKTGCCFKRICFPSLPKGRAELLLL